LHLAAEFGKNPKLVLKLIKHGLNINQTGFQQRTVFLSAVAGGILEIVKLFSNLNSAQLKARDVNNDTALHLAAEFSNDPKLIALLIDWGLPVDAPGFQDQTPLLKAAAAGNLEVVKYLLCDAGASVDAVRIFNAVDAPKNKFFENAIESLENVEKQLIELNKERNILLELMRVEQPGGQLDNTLAILNKRIAEAEQEAVKVRKIADELAIYPLGEKPWLSYLVSSNRNEQEQKSNFEFARSDQEQKVSMEQQVNEDIVLYDAEALAFVYNHREVSVFLRQYKENLTFLLNHHATNKNRLDILLLLLDKQKWQDGFLKKKKKAFSITCWKRLTNILCKLDLNLLSNREFIDYIAIQLYPIFLKDFETLQFEQQTTDKSFFSRNTAEYIQRKEKSCDEFKKAIAYFLTSEYVNEQFKAYFNDFQQKVDSHILELHNNSQSCCILS